MDRTNECQKLLLTTQVLFCILKTVLHLNIKSHTKLCVSTLYKVAPLQLQRHKIRPSKGKGVGGGQTIQFNFLLPQKTPHKKFCITPSSSQILTNYGRPGKLYYTGKIVCNNRQEKSSGIGGGGEGNASETVIEIRIAARMHNATAKPLHAFGVPEACQQEIRGHRFHQEDFDRIQKRDQGSNEEYVDATPEADYA